MALSVGSPLLPSAAQRRNTQESTDSRNPASFKDHWWIGKGRGKNLPESGLWRMPVPFLSIDMHIFPINGPANFHFLAFATIQLFSKLA